ncbi:hypothetical protein C1O51_11190 [Akkermansia muciniphila]|nr:hypothetical protein [Akkermansia muciniphila]PNC53684.1 hypothetical protein CXU06_08910 [Akkermansia muciniphila]PNC70529.1 hypothetical protein CXU05_07200 [Akkermansia muciniphila]QAA53695.1 hypothetical protein C1O50_11215 [Akkermansia muciniphila]QAA56003.1 hypothetical protein C1O51_11190 [Akkermansia muciniphila]
MSVERAFFPFNRLPPPWKVTPHSYGLILPAPEEAGASAEAIREKAPLENLRHAFRRYAHGAGNSIPGTCRIPPQPFAYPDRRALGLQADLVLRNTCGSL